MTYVPLSLDVDTFLDKVKEHFKDDAHTFSLFLNLVSGLSPGNLDDVLRSDQDMSQTVIQLARLLRRSPALLSDLNVALCDGYKIFEYTIKENEVEYFLLLTPSGAEIYPALNSVAKSPTPSLVQEISAGKDLDQLLESNANPASLACFAEVLQFELDRPSVDIDFRCKVIRCLRHLAQSSILPPSMFLRNIAREDGNTNWGLPTACGGFANIHKGVLGGRMLCLKVLLHPRNAGRVLEGRCHIRGFAQEALMWRQLKHPNILPFLGVSEELFAPRVCLISEWMSNGNIMEYLGNHPGHDRLAVLFQVVEGMMFLHGLNPPIAHGDIKGANILVKDDLVCCLCDFGLASVAEQSSEFAGATMHFLAPEIMFPCDSDGSDSPRQGPTLPGDIYALACTVFEIYTGKMPFAEHLIGPMVIAVHCGKRPDLPPFFGQWPEDTEKIWSLVQSCWCQDPVKRPTIKQVECKLREIRNVRQEHELIPSARPTQTSVHFEGRNIKHIQDRQRVEEWLRREQSLIKDGEIDSTSIDIENKPSLSNITPSKHLSLPGFSTVTRRARSQSFTSSHSLKRLSVSAEPLVRCKVVVEGPELEGAAAMLVPQSPGTAVEQPTSKLNLEPPSDRTNRRMLVAFRRIGRAVKSIFGYIDFRQKSMIIRDAYPATARSRSLPPQMMTRQNNQLSPSLKSMDSSIRSSARPYNQSKWVTGDNNSPGTSTREGIWQENYAFDPSMLQVNWML